MAAEKICTEDENIESVVKLLGGSKVLRKRLSTRLDAHDLILSGLPSAALLHLASNVVCLREEEDIQRAVGVSVRTLQRRKEEPRPLSEEQGGRTWKFAEILAQATRVLGSQEEAERWLKSRPLPLSGRRPIDLLATPTGVEMVETLLTQLEYGVYV
ncbi:MAG TPA: antitoxin Xre/MbcA/ParS toxin-binding domain-containing protein [Polyangiaceae bacterium]|jgi:putative toxin-antitoxin system antitoxin component (TIGR02293 family)|nr:antitoxin Xre/MbcA/ParS toxin-binding domain-containing protein [Polyangiaceae bacterium]